MRVPVQPGLCQTWSETPKTGFHMSAQVIQGFEILQKFLTLMKALGVFSGVNYSEPVPLLG